MMEVKTLPVEAAQWSLSGAFLYLDCARITLIIPEYDAPADANTLVGHQVKAEFEARKNSAGNWIGIVHRLKPVGA